MEVKFNVKGKERKNMVVAISEITGSDATYKGVPTCAYEVNYFTIDRFGTLSFDDRVDSEEIATLLEYLEKKGFTAELQEQPETAMVEVDTRTQIFKDETLGLTVTMPKTYFTGESLSNLETLLRAKGSLIKKALGINNLPIETGDEKVSFPWFSITPQDSDIVNAYTHLIYSLCEMARNHKRIQAKEKEVGNEKYAFRCLLLRLGFIGTDYKMERKILLKNFTGSSAFKGGAGNEIPK